jgi:lipoate-protein ligase B
MNAAVADLRVRWLGRMKFQRALALQEEIVLKKREDSSVEDQLLLLEHEAVYTIGRTPDRSSLSARRTAGQIRSGELGAAHLPHPLLSSTAAGRQHITGPDS